LIKGRSILVQSFLSSKDEASIALSNKYLMLGRNYISIDWMCHKPIKSGNDQDRLAQESKVLSKNFKKGSRIILLDERGKLAKNSVQWSQWMQKNIEMAPQGICFAIGGAHGFSSEIKAQASELWSLSPLTLNHKVAHILFFEQLYRSLCIIHSHPYHHDDGSIN
jgi:23S rRNA (pseudouridine1915-N3)-methyltransferase